MNRNESLKICLRCKFFRLKSVDGGVCRNEKDSSGNYPPKVNTDQCSFWEDCGQNYFIRQGWIKSQAKEGNDPEK
ncbi:hypothetical protein [Desulforhopalus sp. IMCC35007]|uniref:hypothetical protein n=1 Tax=Desulforhopalus sp. IMCC35007 TaxID=2569543 RepID=UPI0010AE5D03|nr:hypothetical protein [Desulforhopalus sp. IMCC35007]TKB09331.1 hypothetical protein FCL48_10265 [Desulforhopalus sp. IMCC35007]